MALARVVAFDGVTRERIDELRSEVESGTPSADVPATEILVLHEPQAGSALVVLFFDDEESYARGDATLDAMPAGETPGSRRSVTKYEVAMRAVT